MDWRLDSRGDTVALPDGTYAELVRSLFLPIMPALIMACCFVTVGVVIGVRTGDIVMLGLTATGALAATGRLLIAYVARPLVIDEQLPVAAVRKLERSFAAAFLCFALVLGLAATRAFVVAPERMHILIAAMLFGYGAGVGTGVALRPWISVTAIAVAMAPTLVLALLTPDAMLRTFAVLMAAFASGGISSIIARCRGEAREITMRHLFSTLARRDDLTGLPNRLSLRERFLAASKSDKMGTAIHCLDLDRFKPVNDLHGHPVGDALLKQVAGRLSSLLRHSDFAARIGGDEFVVVQTGIGHAGEAEMLARRILRAVGQPYEIDGRTIEIGTSVGYALSADCGNNLDRLLGCADRALYEAKGTNGIAAHREARDDAA